MTFKLAVKRKCFKMEDNFFATQNILSNLEDISVVFPALTRITYYGVYLSNEASQNKTK